MISEVQKKQTQSSDNYCKRFAIALYGAKYEVQHTLVTTQKHCGNSMMHFLPRNMYAQSIPRAKFRSTHEKCCRF